jgi:carbonic anhydrase
MPVIGTQQSPIEIESSHAIPATFDTSYLQFLYSKPLTGNVDAVKKVFHFDTPGNESNAPDWSITVGAEIWLLRQIHMHAAAEHRVDGADKPFEAHLVHSRPGDTAAGCDKLVVGVFIRPGTSTRAKRSLEKFLRAHATRTAGVAAPTEIDPREFLPDSRLDHFFRYEGSLTGGTLSEDVSWIFMRDDGIVPQPIFSELEKYAEQDERPRQPLNRRFVLKSFT